MFITLRVEGHERTNNAEMELIRNSSLLTSISPTENGGYQVNKKMVTDPRIRPVVVVAVEKYIQQLEIRRECVGRVSVIRSDHHYHYLLFDSVRYTNY